MRVAFQFDVLGRDAFEVLRLIWFRRNVPINRISPKILALTPDPWGKHYDRDRDVIVLTHICRSWGDVFTSHFCLWATLDFVDVDKTRVYLERSKSFLISLSLYRNDDLSPYDPFFEIIPHAVGRLKSPSVDGIQNITGAPLIYFTPPLFLRMS